MRYGKRRAARSDSRTFSSLSLCSEAPSVRSAVFPSLSRNEDEEEGTNGAKRPCPPGINCEPFAPLFLSFDVNYRLPPSQMERREENWKVRRAGARSLFGMHDAYVHPEQIIRTAKWIIPKHHSYRRRQHIILKNVPPEETRLLVRFPSSALRRVNLLL